MTENGVSCSSQSQPFIFDESEYTVTGDDAAIDAFDWENPDEKINYESKDNYCFGPAWTVDEEGTDIIKMKLFYCESGMYLKKISTL